MLIGTRPLRRGLPPLAILGLLASSCRTSVPPKIEICLGDGFGGADCVETDGTQLYRAPSALKDYWMTNQNDETNFASWCYAVSAEDVRPAMAQIKRTLVGEGE